MITPTSTNGGKSNSGGSNNGRSDDSTFVFRGDNSNNNNNDNTDKPKVITGTKKEYTEYIGSINYDPFANIKIVDEEQKEQIE